MRQTENYWFPFQEAIYLVGRHSGTSCRTPWFTTHPTSCADSSVRICNDKSVSRVHAEIIVRKTARERIDTFRASVRQYREYQERLLDLEGNPHAEEDPDGHDVVPVPLPPPIPTTEVFVKDRSRYGTSINGEKIPKGQQRRVSSGDSILFGSLQSKFKCVVSPFCPSHASTQKGWSTCRSTSA